MRQSRLYDGLVSIISEKPYEKKARTRPLITQYTIVEKKKHAVRILLAEDNATNQIVALKILEKLGYRAQAVANGLASC